MLDFRELLCVLVPMSPRKLHQQPRISTIPSSQIISYERVEQTFKGCCAQFTSHFRFANFKVQLGEDICALCSARVGARGHFVHAAEVRDCCECRDTFSFFGLI